MPRISHCVFNTFAIAQLVGTLLAAVAQAGSATVTLAPQACGAGGEWLCYRFYPAEDDPITWTTFEEPTFEIILNLETPAQPARWRPINASAAVGGSAKYGLSYPDSSYSGGASLGGVSFIDSAGSTFFSAGRTLLSFCYDYGGQWICADGNSVARYQQFGEVALGPGLLDPNLPEISEQVKIRFSWSVYGDVPTDSTLQVNGISFGFTLAPIPEPSTAVLVIAGLFALSAGRPRS